MLNKEFPRSCSKKHFNGYHNSRNKRKKSVIICEQCKRPFHSYDIKKKYCSVHCLQLSHREIRADQYLHRICKKIFRTWKCPLCEWNKSFSIHHIIKKSEGGDNNLMNVIMLCPNHHSLADKGQYPIEELKNFAVGKVIEDKIEEKQTPPQEE